MTHAERVFFYRLQNLLGSEYFIFPQIHLSAIFEHKIKGQTWRGAFSHINGKSFDYVICDNDLRPLVAIELDDWSHGLPSRKLRDEEIKRIVNDNNFYLARIRDGKVSDHEITEILRSVGLRVEPA